MTLISACALFGAVALSIVLHSNERNREIGRSRPEKTHRILDAVDETSSCVALAFRALDEAESLRRPAG